MTKASPAPPQQLQHPAGSRFARAAQFAERNRLRFVVQDGESLVQHKQPVAPYLHAFAQEELNWMLDLIADFHAALVSELTRTRRIRKSDVCVIAANRVQALIGQLELAKAKE